jgi:Tol biopolymer transport system component
MLAAGQLQAQVRGAELFQLMGREVLARTTGTTRLQWLPGGGYLESANDSSTGGKTFFRVDPATQKRTPLFGDRVTAGLLAEYARATGKESKGLPFTVFTWEQGGKAIGWGGGSGNFVYDLEKKTLRTLKTPPKTGPLDLATPSPGTWSPDYSRYAFIRDYDNLWLFDPATGAEEQLVKGTSEDNLVGFLGAGAWYVWSPDSRRLAYLKVSQSGTPYPITNSVPHHATVLWFKYPFTTDSTARMELWVVDLQSKEHQKLAESTIENPWIKDIAWLPGGTEVSWQLMNQWQSRLEVNASDVTTGSSASSSSTPTPPS